MKNENKSNSKRLPLILFSAGLLGLPAVSALGQEQAQAPSQVKKLSKDITQHVVTEEIVVSARRRDELLEDVPMTVQAVSGESLEELNLFNLDDLSKVLAGVNLSRAGGITTIRGVSFNPTAQTNPATAFYINEGPVQSATALQAMFDVGQIEVLRGPQGTLRGQSAPTGAITISTRSPELSQLGGNIMTTATDADGSTLQGAINLPVVEDVFGIRIAGISDQKNNGGIHSVKSTADPFSETDAYRISALYEPADNLTAKVMYQKLKIDSMTFGDALIGNGSPGGTFKASAHALPITLAPGYNGPVIKEGERKTVREYGDRSASEQEFASAQIDYTAVGQVFSYVGGYTTNTGEPATNFGDVGNLVIGDWPGRNLASDLTRITHEFRIASDEPIAGLVDYTVGVFNLDEEIENVVNNGTSFQNGAFGSPLGAPNPFAPNLKFSTVTYANTDTTLEEWSYFGNITVHVTDQTEVSAGVRFINAEKDGVRINSQGSGYRAQVLAEPNCLAAGGAFGATYTGVCDAPVASRITGTILDQWDKSTEVYSASLSHHFNDDLMAYVSYGTSWRPGPTQGQLVNGTNDPLLNSFVTLEDEESQSIEVGLKTSWLDNRLSANLAIYRQTYDNFVLSDLTGIPYLADTGVGVRSVGLSIPMNSNVDVDVDGVDVDLSFAATDSWTISGGLSWADAGYENELVPCWDGNFDGTPDRNNAAFNPASFDAAGVKLAQCPASGAASQIPKWNATLRSNYSFPISVNLEGFVSGVITHTPENPYANPAYTAPDYTRLDLNLGVRDDAAGWELQVFARNLTDEDEMLAVGTTDLIPSLSSAPGSLFGPSGYVTASYIAPREIGLTFRYAFGSR